MHYSIGPLVHEVGPLSYIMYAVVSAHSNFASINFPPMAANTQNVANAGSTLDAVTSNANHAIAASAAVSFSNNGEAIRSADMQRVLTAPTLPLDLNLDKPTLLQVSLGILIIGYDIH